MYHHHLSYHLFHIIRVLLCACYFILFLTLARPPASPRISAAKELLVISTLIQPSEISFYDLPQTLHLHVRVVTKSSSNVLQ